MCVCVCVCVCVSCSVVSDSARLLCLLNSPGKNTGVGSHFPSPEGLPDPGIEPRIPASQVDSLTTELPGKSYLPRRCGKEPTSEVVGQTEFPSVWHCLLGLSLVAFFNTLSHL